jgi:hypothetical protein
MLLRDNIDHLDLTTGLFAGGSGLVMTVGLLSCGDSTMAVALTSV